MRAVIQRVSQGSVTVKGKIVGRVGKGFVVFLGVGHEDTEEDASYIAKKIVNMRIFEDHQGKMNLSLEQVDGGVLLVSQFTLYGDTRKGNRPSFVDAAPQDQANRLYGHCLDLIKESGIPTESGIFQAEMAVEIHNDGPVTLVIDSKRGD
ncbi:MAG: D-aminoacyl-tRNA deacylase [Anaerovoracaceae bacterium]|jgi:D-tyrosyl-tRNA(Tyr) deacylase|nr:D-aminoacyl-tRNA deacylase [Anaerovoracaceae bacterium]